MSGDITDAEAAIYDRQIRLWGVEAQHDLRASSVLIVGVNGLSMETAKNLTLAGVHSIVLWDPGMIDNDDVQTNFYFTVEDIGSPRASILSNRLASMNTFCSVTSLQHSFEDLRTYPPTHPDIITTLSSATVVACVNLPQEYAFTLSLHCTDHGKSFFYAETRSLLSFFVSYHSPQKTKLFNEKFIEPRTGKRQANTNPVLIKDAIVIDDDDEDEQLKWDITLDSFSYQPFHEMWLLKKRTATQPPRLKNSQFIAANKMLTSIRADRTLEYIRKFPQNQVTELDTNELSSLITQAVPPINPPIPALSSIVGGLLSQDIANSITRQNYPIHNSFIFDATTTNGGITCKMTESIDVP
ncbi:putative SUMO-activating enzyme subunit aos-1 [Blattamonas nauphoetae]|uniref:SUMO-activating enzyme subunit aos-1 n=1 Tax=Blattamonas nauphoetae TaxID=2049346 RepID=A0ABQ9XP53_9EUKA|nr:putative SUMO-activating enzyme subunit aos-1 [Blattamonas nauphoetae]